MGRNLGELANTKLLWPKTHRFQRQIGVTQEPLEMLEFSAEKINHLSQITYQKGPRRALLYSNQNHLVSQDSTVSEPCSAFHSFRPL